MGKKSKSTTTTYQTTTTKTKVVKLSYVQTLATFNDLADVTQLQTAGSSEDTGSSSKGKSGFLGLGSKKKTTVSSQESSSGEKLKDQWLQPEFDRIRYAIGVREMTVSSYEFSEEAEFVSVPYLSPKEIVKVNIIVDQYIPPQFDQNQNWIDYYIKPEGSEEWIKINPLNHPTKFDSSGDIVPKIINFNLPKPATAQLEDKYQTTDDPVKQFRFRAVIRRPSGGNFDSMTPLLKSYRMVMTPRS